MTCTHFPRNGKKLVQRENSPLQVMTKLEISRKIPEYYFFRFAENACKSSRKPRKISVNLSEIRRFQEIFINLRAYERSNGETRDSSRRASEIRDTESPRSEHARLEHACGGDGAGRGRLRALAVDARRGVARRGAFSAACRSVDGEEVGVGRGVARSGVRGWGGGGAGARCGGGRRRASRLAVDGGRGVGGRAKPRPTRGRVDGGGVVGMRGV
jgi:hypothetical protein